MKLCLLRGHVPQDRSPDEIKYRTIDEVDDIYELIAYHLGNEGAEILYEGGKREVAYSDKCICRWVPSLKKHKTPWEPDVIFARGGFDFYKPFLKKYPKAIKIYYGAGGRFNPEDGMNYNFILVDSVRQQQIAQVKGFFNVVVWEKPVAPIFQYTPKERKYDVCFVAAIPEDERKNVAWVYETCPRDLSVLQLGLSSKKTVPQNVTVRHLLRSDMPRAMNKCKIGIIPYTKQDSGPRAMGEMMACGLPVVCLDGVPHCMPVNICEKDVFWSVVMKKIEGFSEADCIARSEMTKLRYSPQKSADFIRGLLWD